jgi:hypothetical protein
MTPLDYGSLQVRSSWLAQVRKSKKSILLGAGDPPVLLSHFIVAIAHHVKVYGQHGAFFQRFDMACKVVRILSGLACMTRRKVDQEVALLKGTRRLPTKA